MKKLPRSDRACEDSKYIFYIYTDRILIGRQYLNMKRRIVVFFVIGFYFNRAKLASVNLVHKKRERQLQGIIPLSNPPTIHPYHTNLFFFFLRPFYLVSKHFVCVVLKASCTYY